MSKETATPAAVETPAKEKKLRGMSIQTLAARVTEINNNRENIAKAKVSGDRFEKMAYECFLAEFDALEAYILELKTEK